MYYAESRQAAEEFIGPAKVVKSVTMPCGPGPEHWVVVLFQHDDPMSIGAVCYKDRPIGFVEAKMAPPEWMEAVEAYRAGKLNKKDA